jgi:hypothetical protein
VLNTVTGTTITDFALGADKLSFAGLSSAVFSTNFNIGTQYFSVDLDNNGSVDFGATLTGVSSASISSAFDAGLGHWVVSLI